MKTTLSHLPFFAAVLLASGCTTLDCTSLQQAMAANHKATISLLNKTNEEDLPLIKRDKMRDVSPTVGFSEEDLSMIAPTDIAAWDKILSGLDAYCTALVTLTSGKSSSDFSTAAESLGSNIQSLGKKLNVTVGSKASYAETAITELGSVLIQQKAEKEAQGIAKKADPSFQAVIQDLIDALGYTGNPLKRNGLGTLGMYEQDFSDIAAVNGTLYPNDSIAKFASMSSDDRGKAIDGFTAWLKVKQDHDDFAESYDALATALYKTAQAHAALANGSKETASSALAALKAQIQNSAAIYQKFK